MDPYRVLGVSRDASAGEIEAAYRARRQNYNPEVAWEEWELVQLQEAYEQILREKGRYAEKGRREPQGAHQDQDQERWGRGHESPQGESSRQDRHDPAEAYLWAYSGVIGGALFGAVVGAIAASGLGGSSIVGAIIGFVVGALAGNLGGASQPPRS